MLLVIERKYKAKMEAKCCPFCKDEESLDLDVGRGYSTVICENCGAEGPGRTEPIEAIEKWNEAKR